MNPNYNYIYICERISRYDFKWRHLAGLMVKAARLGNEVEFAEDSEHNPARVPVIKALREVLDRSMGIHLSLKNATELVDYAVKIASGSLYEDTEIDVLQNKLNAIYCPKEEDDDDLAAEAVYSSAVDSSRRLDTALDAEPVSNMFGVVRYYSNGSGEIHYLSLQSYGCLWVRTVKEATRLDLLVAKGFLDVYSRLTNKSCEDCNTQYYLVVFT